MEGVGDWQEHGQRKGANPAASASCGVNIFLIRPTTSHSQTFLEKRYSDDLELEDAVHTAILTLKEGFEGQISGHNIEIGVVGADRVFRVLSVSEVNDYLEETA